MSTRAPAKSAPRPPEHAVREPSAAYLAKVATRPEAPRCALLDVNMLIALLDADHVHHRRASDWLSDNLSAGWASCAVTQNGCIRIMSQPAYPNALPTARVAERLRAATGTQHHRFIPGSLSLLDTERFDTERLLGHRAVTDAYLLGLAVQNDLRLVTFDGAIPLAAVRGAARRHVVAL
jgi:toxin-antitoxin system PIN domain toxin